ncbi:hypothetical protein NHL50_12725 [Acidimicrobiia bacterium EGI L10123]|uniref:hypothetical protein n=1 Tax=Salinilacustrithrix flava TaxID=2957203 RepID=UPI003D7C1961|nr:hypothetical protein [Acidimicrobiia bacterium EGI L10123]
MIGGYAIEAFTGTTRLHGDLDIAVFRRDVPALQEHLGGQFHLWSVGSGSLRPLLFPDAGIHAPELPNWAGQVWIRRKSTEPWLIDVVTTKDRAGMWTSRLDPDLALPLEDVVWVPEEGPFAGMHVQRPEFVLAHKARHDNPKDRSDLQLTLPLLDGRARAVLCDLLARWHPGHEWLRKIADHEARREFTSDLRRQS